MTLVTYGLMVKVKKAWSLTSIIEVTPIMVYNVSSVSLLSPYLITT